MPERGSSTHRVGRRIAAHDIVDAMTRAPLRYGDGATQSFTPDGRTVYRERGGRTEGEWGVDREGRFWSFWPPDYRASYDVYWIIEAGSSGMGAAGADVALGVRFVERRKGAVSDGCYQFDVTRG